MSEFKGEPEHPVLAAAYDKIKKHRDSVHWTEQADLLGQIEDEGIWREVVDPLGDTPAAGYRERYGSFRAWALDELGLSAAELTEMLKHYRIARSCEPAIEYPGPWKSLSPSQMRQLRRVFPNEDPKRWVTLAATLASASALEREIDKSLGREKWATFKVAVPGDQLESAEAMLRLALPDVLATPSPDAARVKDRDVRFRCFEKIVVHSMATYRTLVEPPPCDATAGVEPDWYGTLVDETLTDQQLAAFFALPGNVRLLRVQMRRRVDEANP